MPGQDSLSSSSNTPNNNDAWLRLDFIEMMFALAVGQVGLEIGDFFDASMSISTHPYVMTHLILAVYIIASSWVGWQRSKSRGSREPLLNPFDKSFYMLLIDLFLVICYFIIVKGVDKPRLANQENFKPDSMTEVAWSGIIFINYCVWDIIAKLINVVPENNYKLKLAWGEYLPRCYQAIICLLLGWIFILPTSHDISSRGVVLTDIALLSVFVLFRALKSDFKRRSDRNFSLSKIFWLVLPILSILSIYIIYLVRQKSS
jgi:hypothetical protein